jgi:hypothetical protein
MNLVDTLAKEHSKAQCDRIVKYIGNRPDRFDELVQVFLAGPCRLTQRAGWPLSYCVEPYGSAGFLARARKVLKQLD